MGKGFLMAAQITPPTERARSATPGADVAAVHVDEVGARIFPNTTTAAGRCGFEHLTDRARFQSQVNGLAFHVQRIPRNASGAPPQHRVGLRGAIAGQHHVGFVGVQKVVGGGHDVDGSGVDHLHFVGAPVAHEVGDLFDGLVDILAVNPVDGVNALTRPSRIHRDLPDIATASAQAKSIRHCWGSRQSGCCKSLQNPSAGKTRIFRSHRRALSRRYQPSVRLVAMFSPSARFLWHSLSFPQKN